MKLLKNLASQRSCAILLTIHQPSSQIFYLFDVVVYMKEGRIFYLGPTNEILSYYAVKGYTCPSGYNPSDFIMDLCQSESGKSLEAKGLFLPIPETFLHFSERFNNNNNQGQQLQAQDSIKFHEDEIVFHFESSFMKQLVLLTYRECINTIRDYHMLIVKFFITCFMNFITGLLFLGIGKTSYDNMTDFNSHFGGIMMLMMFSLMGSAQSVMLGFPFERPMILREYVTGTCKTAALISFFSFLIFSSTLL